MRELLRRSMRESRSSRVDCSRRVSCTLTSIRSYGVSRRKNASSRNGKQSFAARARRGRRSMGLTGCGLADPPAHSFVIITSPLTTSSGTQGSRELGRGKRPCLMINRPLELRTRSADVAGVDQPPFIIQRPWNPARAAAIICDMWMRTTAFPPLAVSLKWRRE